MQGVKEENGFLTGQIPGAPSPLSPQAQPKERVTDLSWRSQALFSVRRTERWREGSLRPHLFLPGRLWEAEKGQEAERIERPGGQMRNTQAERGREHRTVDSEGDQPRGSLPSEGATTRLCDPEEACPHPWGPPSCPEQAGLQGPGYWCDGPSGCR